MTTQPTANKEKTEYELIKKNSVYKYMTSTLKCKDCGETVISEWATCPKCGGKQAVDTTEEE